MTGFFHRRWLVSCVAVVVGWACWKLEPGTDVDGLAFSAVMRGFANPPFFTTGQGTRDDPWSLRTLSVRNRIDSGKAPVVVSIGDDPGGIFQSSPPSPVDFAVVLKNLQRLGAKQAAIAAVLAWQEPDPASLKGLEMVLDDFQMVIHAAPLSRGTVRQPLPPAFRHASLPPDAIQGDGSKLPIVNRVAVPDVIFGGERALAGFSSLDNAGTGSGALPLLARWEEEERVVLAFPLLAVLARYDLPVAGITVKPGEFLQLGPAGPVVPIDASGCLSLPPKPVPSRADVSAESLITGTPDIFPASPGLIVLRDDQSTAPRATRKFSANLASAIAAIGSDAGLGPPRAYRRLSMAWEGALLLTVVVVLTTLSGRTRFQRLLGCGILAALCLASQWLAAGGFQVWLPGIPLLAAILAGTPVLGLLGEAPRAIRSQAPRRKHGAKQARLTKATGLTRTTRHVVALWREPIGRREPSYIIPSWPEVPMVESQPMPPIEEVIPLVEEAAPVVEQPAPQVEESTDLTESSAVPTEEPVILTEESVFLTNESAPPVEDAATPPPEPAARKGNAGKARAKEGPAPTNATAKRTSGKSTKKQGATRKSRSNKKTGAPLPPPETPPQ